MGKIGNKRKSELTDEEVVNAYKKSLSVYAVEKETGISATTIYRILERNGVERKGLNSYREKAAAFNAKKSSEIRKKYENGAHLSDLAAEYGSTYSSIKSAIKRAGGNFTPVFSHQNEQEVQTIIDLYKSGMSQMKISLEIGRSQSLVSQILRKNGFVYTVRSGEKSSQWKGGTYKGGDGYIWVKNESTKLYPSMQNQSGYILEHRLIMAMSLGRPLTKNETVHHINNDKADNRIENLQLRRGRHGKHSVMVCLDCGSHNLGYAPIADEK